MSEPTTKAGRRLLEMLELRWVDEPTNRGMADREWVHAIAAIEAEARAAALASFTDLLDSIDSIVDDTHPEGDGCSLCEALDDMRALLDAETAGADAEGSREP